jgi:alpha-D-ribose 1-methylphosphonate 5-triphosphate synthase subunit PhnG
MSITRCALRLDDGAMGLAYVAGRDQRHAELAALFDALLQTGEAGYVDASVLQPLRAAQEAERAALLQQAQATKVEFMTMVRGEDA